MALATRRHHELIEVVHPDQMEDEMFYQHLNARHMADYKMTRDTSYSKLYSAGLIRVMRAFHRRVHLIATYGQHDHYHTGGV